MNAKHKFSARVVSWCIIGCMIIVLISISTAEPKPRQYKKECSYCGPNWFHQEDFECPNKPESELVKEPPIIPETPEKAKEQ